MKLYAVIENNLITKISMGPTLPSGAIEIPNSGEVFVGDTLAHFVDGDPHKGRRPLKELYDDGLVDLDPTLEVNEKNEIVEKVEPETEPTPEEVAAREEQERKNTLMQQKRDDLYTKLEQQTEPTLKSLQDQVDALKTIVLSQAGRVDLSQPDIPSPGGGGDGDVGDGKVRGKSSVTTHPLKTWTIPPAYVTREEYDALLKKLES